MEFERVAKELRPLMPDSVDHWLRVWESGDARMRQLIERRIYSEAYRTLGNDFKRKPLFSLPPEKISKGEFHLGTVLYENEKWNFGLSRKELNRNLAILGMSGAGKSNIVFVLLEQLVDKGIPFLFFDWKKTVRHCLSLFTKPVKVYTVGKSLAPFPFNPLIPPPGVEINLYVNQLIDVLSSAYTLGDGAKSLIQKAVLSCLAKDGVYPSVQDVLSAVERIDAKGRAIGWKATAQRALESLHYANFASAEKGNQKKLISTLCKEPTVLELDGLDQSAKEFLVSTLALWVYYFHLQQPERETLRHVLFVEEAHHVLHKQVQRSKETVMEQLMRQCRELGMAMVVIDQHPHLLSSAALGNSYTTICLNQKDPTDINKAAGVCLLDDSEKRWLSMLPVGQGIVKLQDRWRRPFVVRFPLMPVRKGSVSDEDISGYFRGEITLSQLRASQPAIFRPLPRSRLGDTPVSEGVLAFVQDIISYRDDGVDARYKRLGWSADKGNRVKNQLLSHGWIEEGEVKVGRTRKLALRLNSEAKKHLGIEDEKLGYKESVAHEYWKNRYADKLREEGYEVIVEAARQGGRVDILAWNGKEVLGVEIETGKSDFIGNIRNCLATGFSRVLVMATDRKAYERIQRAVREVGLVIPSRVEVQLG